MFHGTLQYGYQLLDEVPMIYLITSSAWTLYERNNREVSQNGRLLATFLFCYNALLTLALLTTEQDTSFHKG